jgi:protein-tyrosine phosphatase
MAHGILRAKIKEKGLDWEVDSAGTGHWHIGEAPDSRAAAAASAGNIDISDLRARQLKPEDFYNYDWILVMDDSNYRNAQTIAPDDATAHVQRLTDFHPDAEVNRVPDPYLEGGFDHVFQLVHTAVDHWIDAQIEKNS